MPIFGLGSPMAQHDERAANAMRLLDGAHGRARHRFEDVQRHVRAGLGLEASDVDEIIADVFLLGLYSGHLQAELDAGAFPGDHGGPGVTRKGQARGLIVSSKTLASQIRGTLRRSV